MVEGLLMPDYSPTKNNHWVVKEKMHQMLVVESISVLRNPEGLEYPQSVSLSEEKVAQMPE